jgi:hypothetical protein
VEVLILLVENGSVLTTKLVGVVSRKGFVHGDVAFCTVSQEYGAEGIGHHYTTLLGDANVRGSGEILSL